MKTLTRVLGFAVCLGMLGAPARAATSVDDIIAKARAHVGPEDAITAVQSLHFIGTVVSSQGGSQQSLPIELIFQKPYRQRVTVTGPEKVEITGLDGYEGWQVQQSKKDPKSWGIKLFLPAQLRAIRANVWENLAFFRSGEPTVRVEDRGSEVVDGVACRKLAYIHNDQDTFYRYFDTNTGRLVLTETDKGVQTRESGEITAGGLRFAKQVVSSQKAKDGSDVTVTITFDQIAVNETFPDSQFSVPSQRAGGTL